MEIRQGIKDREDDNDIDAAIQELDACLRENGREREGEKIA